MTRTPFSFKTTFVCKGAVVVDWRVNILSAKKFMESKETTARYYNLLPNKGHAVRITMKLYKKFIGPESV